MSRDLLFHVPEDMADEMVATGKEGSKYKRLDGVVMGRAPAVWFTNLDHPKRHEELILYRRYSPEAYPTYDNYDAINVDKVKDIPEDYDGVMGVPITFLDKHNPDQFEILNANDIRVDETVRAKPHGLIKDKESAIDGQPKYVRIAVRRKG